MVSPSLPRKPQAAQGAPTPLLVSTVASNSKGWIRSVSHVHRAEWKGPMVPEQGVQADPQLPVSRCDPKRGLTGAQVQDKGQLSRSQVAMKRRRACGQKGAEVVLDPGGEQAGV